MKNYNIKPAFTFLEIILTLTIISILASIVIRALNPVKHLGDTQNARRRSDVNAIVNAIAQYTLDHNGVLPADITSDNRPICKAKVSSTACQSVNAAYLPELIINESYLVSIPYDPMGHTEFTTGYFIKKSPNNKIYVSAPLAEQNETIIVSK